MSFQGRTPLPYALAELIDNSLRATQHQTHGQRQIQISFVLGGAGQVLQTGSLLCLVIKIAGVLTATSDSFR